MILYISDFEVLGVSLVMVYLIIGSRFMIRLGVGVNVILFIVVASCLGMIFLISLETVFVVLFVTIRVFCICEVGFWNGL